MGYQGVVTIVPDRGAPPAAGTAAIRQLSVCQHSLWLLYKIAPESAAYNDGDAVRLSPAPDEEILRRAVRATVERHDILRSVFTDADGTPSRVVCAPDLVRLHVRDAGAVTDAELGVLARETVAVPFRLSETGPLRVVLLRRPDDAVLVVAAHHIATDASSQYLIWRDLFEAYLAFAAGSEPAWPVLRATYDDYVRRERALLDSPRGARLAEYWNQVCAGGTAAELPADRTRPPRQGFSGATCNRRLPDDLAGQVRDASARLGVTPFACLLGAFQSLLYRYTGQPDLIIGCPATVRRSRAMRDIVGLFVNPMALRARFTPMTTFAEAVASASRQLAEGSARVSYPLALRSGAGAGRAPLFRIAFTMVSADPDNPLPDLAADGRAMNLGGHQMTCLEIPHLEGQFDLSVEITRTARALNAVFRYDTDLFDAQTIERLADRYLRMVAAACSEPGARVTRVPLVDDRERQRILALGLGDSG